MFALSQSEQKGATHAASSRRRLLQPPVELAPGRLRHCVSPKMFYLTEFYQLIDPVNFICEAPSTIIDQIIDIRSRYLDCGFCVGCLKSPILLASRDKNTDCGRLLLLFQSHSQ